MTNNRIHMTGVQHAAFRMPARTWSLVAALRALPLATTAVINETKGDFPGFHAWSPPS